jgi:DNA-binding XRE family transcriptional regulator
LPSKQGKDSRRWLNFSAIFKQASKRFMKIDGNERARMVAANIRKIREFRNYTQEYLAAKLGISQNAYSKIELGYCNITLNRLFYIAAILEIDAVDLISADVKQLVQIRSAITA